jgi:hypothetical protein
VETVKQFKYSKIWKLKKIWKKFGLFFSIILPEIISDPFSPSWSHQPGLKGPPAFCTRPGPCGGPLFPVYEQPGLKRRGFSLGWTSGTKAPYQPRIKPLFLPVNVVRVLPTCKFSTRNTLYSRLCPFKKKQKNIRGYIEMTKSLTSIVVNRSFFKTSKSVRFFHFLQPCILTISS